MRCRTQCSAIFIPFLLLSVGLICNKNLDFFLKRRILEHFALDYLAVYPNVLRNLNPNLVLQNVSKSFRVTMREKIVLSSTFILVSVYYGRNTSLKRLSTSQYRTNINSYKNNAIIVSLCVIFFVSFYILFSLHLVNLTFFFHVD